MKRFLLFCVCLLCCFAVKSQTYPVTVVPTVKQPAPIYFSSYADANAINGPLRVQILLNDLTIGNREIRLKTYVEGNGINFQSNTIVNGASPLFLEGGIPLVLNSTDLAPYFEFSNSTGISAVAYGQPIPEGSYQFCFEVYDAVSGNRISQKSCANAYIFQNEPPFLVLPQNKTAIQEQNPQNIVFQWTPRHINVTNVEYELSLVEIWDTYVDPQAAFLSSRPIFQTTTQKTTYIYSPTDPLLLPNKRYAWRVQAKAKQGAEDIGLFKNNGYSEIFWFTHTTPCKTPQNVTHEVKGMREASIFWDEFSTDIPEFTVRYREKAPSASGTSPQGGGKEGAWFTSRSTANWVTLWDLRPGTVYEYQVAKKCELVNSEYSKVKTFTTFLAEDELGLYNCGIPPDIDISNQTPLAELKKGDVFKAGDFPVKVLEVSGTNGRFTGKGYVSIPYLSSIKVAVEFTNVFVNAESQLAEGMVITKYDPTWGNIADIDGLIDSVESMGDVFSGGDDITENVDFEVKEVKVEGGKVVITGTNGEVKKIDHDKGDDYTITDSKGNQWSVNENGNVTQSGEADDSPQLTADNTDGIKSGSHEGTVQDPRVDKITSEDVVITFRSGEDTQYALDKVENQYETNNYPKIESSDGSVYFPVHKAVVDDRTDVFYADVVINNPAISIDSINIKTSKGTAILHELNRENNTFKITVKGNNPYHTEEAVVTYLDPEDNNYKIAGTFYIHHIKRFEPIDVKIVPVGSSNGIADIEEQLNKIYKQVGVTFNVSVEDNFNLNMASWDDNNDEVITYDAAGLMKDYPNELKNIIKAYKSYNPSYDDKSYYLFVMDSNIKVSKPLGGFMPKTRQWGFLFEAYCNISEDELESKGSAVKIAAHELGHGAFTLEHPFGENIDNAGITGNWLMDYGSGTDLSVPDWQMLSDQSLKLYLFQEEEDGRYEAYEHLIGHNVVPGVFNQYDEKIDKNPISFISNAGKIITLPNNVEDVTFNDNGLLWAFTVYENGKKERYVSSKWSKEGSFAGYLKRIGSNKDWENVVYQDEVSKTLPLEVTIYSGLLTKDSGTCGIDLYRRSFQNKADKNEWNIGGNKEPMASTNYVANIEPFVTNISSPEACDFCAEGDKFVQAYKNISDPKIQEKIFEIGRLICQPGEFSKEFFDEFKINGYNNLLAWQKNFYNEGNWKNDFEAFSSFYEAYNKYLDYYDNVKVYISSHEDKEALLRIAYDINNAQLRALTAQEKLYMLKIISNGNMGGYWTSSKYNIEALSLKIISSVNNDYQENQGAIFLDGLTDDKYKVDDKLLYLNLFKKIEDFFGDKNFEKLAVTLTNLSLLANNINPNLPLSSDIIEEKAKEHLLWDVKNDSFLWVFNLVRDKSELKINYNKQHTINIKQGCEKFELKGNKEYNTYVCTEYTIDIDLKPFDLVGLQIINDITFTNQSGACNRLGAVVCGKEVLVPAAFLYFLNKKKQNAITQNIVTNTLTAASIYSSGAQIAAARGVINATTKVAYLDLFITFSDPYVSSDKFISHASIAVKNVFQLKNDENSNKVAEFLQGLWSAGSTIYEVKGYIDNIKAIATYKALKNKVGESDAKKILSDNTEFADKAFENFEKLEKDMVAQGDKKILDNETKKIELQIEAIIDPLAISGKVEIGKPNLYREKSIAGKFKSFNYKANDIDKQIRAGTFWKNENPAEKIAQYISLDGKYYVKVDTDISKSRRLLFFDVENKKALGWGLLPDSMKELKNANDYESMIDELKFIHGLEKEVTKINFGEKGSLIRSLQKANAYLGSYNPRNAPSAGKELGTKDVLDRYNIYKNYLFADNNQELLEPGSVLMLNVPDQIYKPTTFFDDFNKKFLDYLIANKDKVEIIFTTKPEYQDLFKAWDSNINDYQRNRPTNLFEPSGFAKEIKYLRDRGIKTVKFKDGSSINLDEVDLSEMDWITNWKY